MLLGGVGGTHMLLASGAVAVAAGVLELDSSRCARLPIKREARQLLQIRFCTCESSVVQQFGRCTKSWRAVIGCVGQTPHQHIGAIHWDASTRESEPCRPNCTADKHEGETAAQTRELQVKIDLNCWRAKLCR